MRTGDVVARTASSCGSGALCMWVGMGKVKQNSVTFSLRFCREELPPGSWGSGSGGQVTTASKQAA